MWIKLTQKGGEPVLINTQNVFSVVPKANGSGTVFNTVVTVQNSNMVPTVKTVWVQEDIDVITETLASAGWK